MIDMWKVIVLWLGWCAAHSLLITASTKQWFERRGGAWLGLYRIGYVCFSLCTLLPAFWYTAALPQRPIHLPFWVWPVQCLLFLYALIMFIGGSRIYDLQIFLGIRQWRDYRAGRTSRQPMFMKRGILQYVRHPWYSGGIALLWSLPGLTDVTLVTRIILTLYLIFGTHLEDRKLRQSLGAPYHAYCQKTPMLLPWRFGD
jgi:methanethiol S-methyltransferase